MKKTNLLILAVISLFTACKERSYLEMPVAESLSKASISLAWDTIGAGEMVALLANQTYANIQDGEPGERYTFELSAANGAYHTDSLNYTGEGNFDSSGHAAIHIPSLTRYNDGELLLKVTVGDTIITAKNIKQETVIRNYRDFMYMYYPRRNVRASFVQSRDFAFPDTIFTSAPNDITLNGIYDGQGHKISNLKIIDKSEQSMYSKTVGLFNSAVTGAIIRNLRLELKDTGIYVNNAIACGGLVGFSSRSTIINCSVKGNVIIPGSQTSSCGGLIGDSNQDTIIASGFKGSLIGYFCGGIVGSGFGSMLNLTYGYWYGTMAMGGGLIGYASGGDIANSYAYTYSIDYTYDYYAIQRYMQEATVTNVFASSGTPNTGVTMYDGRNDLIAAVTAYTMTNWPAGVTPPADNKPFKGYDIPKLWWE